MVIYKSVPIVHPIFLNSLVVLLATSLSETISPDEQAIVGAFLSTLGDMISFNSAYLSYIQQNNSSEDQESKDQYDLLKKSIDKIQEELEKIKQ